MKEERIGAFICELRKEKNMTQKELAQRLSVTDKAVSKWERGGSCPDIALLVPLSEVLEVTVAELLAGERQQQAVIEVENAREYVDAKVEQVFSYSDLSRKERRRRGKRIGFVCASGVFLVAGAVCMICELGVSGRLGWSYLVLASLVLAWVVLVPSLLIERNTIMWALGAASVGVIPYLFVLGYLLGNRGVGMMGSMIAVCAILAVWLCFFMIRNHMDRPFRAIGFVCVMMVLLNLGINRIIGAWSWYPGSVSRVDQVGNVIIQIVVIVCALLFYGIDMIKWFRNRR